MDPVDPTEPLDPIDPGDADSGYAADSLGDGDGAWSAAAAHPLSAPARVWRGASLEPRRFFAALPDTAPLGPAVLYYLVIGMAVAGAQLFWSMIFRAAGINIGGMLGMMDGDAAWGPLVDFLLAPVLLLLSLFVAAGVTHLVLKMLGGASRGYGFTVRIFAFAYSPQILGVIPFIGQAVGFVWMCVVAIVGLSAGHRTSTGRAAAAVLIPVAIVIMFAVIAAMIAAAGTLLLPG